MRIDACRIRFLQSIDIRTCQLTYRRCMMLNTFGGFFVLGILKGWKQSVGLLATISVFIILNSLQGHKESRFLAPIYPIIIIFSAHGLQQINVLFHKRKYLKFATRLALVGDKLRFSIDKNVDDSISISVFFLTPCHVTPFQGYLQRENVKVDFISSEKCEVGSNIIQTGLNYK